MDEAERPVPMFARIPVYAGRSGQTMVSTEIMLIFLRSVANVADISDDPKALAMAIRVEADALECRAIEKTRRPR